MGEITNDRIKKHASELSDIENTCAALADAVIAMEDRGMPPEHIRRISEVMSLFEDVREEIVVETLDDPLIYRSEKRQTLVQGILPSEIDPYLDAHGIENDGMRDKIRAEALTGRYPNMDTMFFLCSFDSPDESPILCR